MIKLFDTLNNLNYDFFFLVVDNFLDIKIPQLKNFYSISNSTLKVKNSGNLLALASTQEFIKKTVSQSGNKPVIIPFKPSAKIDLICKHNNWILAANPASINRLLEDKIKFLEICQKHSLPTVPSLIDKFNQGTFQEAQQKLGTKLVIQTHFGWAGNSSHLAQDYLSVKDKIEANTIVKYSSYFKGYSLINNCCYTNSRLIQSPPGLQYTGIKSLTKNPLATVGRQWPSFAPKEIIDQTKQITNQFKKILDEYNYRGFFGLDFLVSQNNVYLLECNPRLTASFAFYTNLEIKNNFDPLFLHHIAEFLNLKTEIIDRSEANIIGSEITKKNSNGTTINKYNDYFAFINNTNYSEIPANILKKVL